MKYRINFGHHRMRDNTGKTIIHKQGDILTSDVDLAEAFKIYDVQSQMAKFTEVADVAVNKPSFERGKRQ